MEKLKALFVSEDFERPLLITVEKAKQIFRIKGYTENYSEIRKKGYVCPCELLDNQPEFEGFCGPMKQDDNTLRYESYKMYNELSI